MSEAFNFRPEFVSDDELLVLADFYTSKIKLVNQSLEFTTDGSVEHQLLRKEKFRLMQRRYYLRICHRARTTGNYHQN